VWEIASGKEVLTVPSEGWHGDVLFSAEGSVLIGNVKGPINLHQIPAATPKLMDAKGLLLDFTPNGKHLLTSIDNTLLHLELAIRN